MNYTEKNDGFITSSKLKLFQTCQFCYKCKYVDGLADPTEDKDCFVVGSAFDLLVTSGEQKYKDTYDVVARRSDKAEKVQLTNGQNEIIRQMEKEFREQPLFAVKPEKQVFEVEFGGFKLRGELDDFDPDEQLIRDIKTCASVVSVAQKPDMYILQMAFYQLLIEESTGVRCSALLEFVDKYTYFSRSLPVQYTADTLFSYRGQIIQALEDLKIAQETGVYLPADSQEVLWCCPYYSVQGHGRKLTPIIL